MVNFQYTFSNVKIYDRVLHKELNTNAGGLWKWLNRKGEVAVAKAKRQAGYKTGQLRRSIHMNHLGNATGQYLWIGSKVKHAYLHHEGTKRHVIIPNSPDGKLVFMSSRTPRRVIAVKKVRHPGTKPNRYLSDQLRVFIT